MLLQKLSLYTHNTHIISVIRLFFTTFVEVYTKIVLSSEGFKLKKITKKEIENKNIS